MTVDELREFLFEKEAEYNEDHIEMYGFFHNCPVRIYREDGCFHNALISFDPELGVIVE